MFFFSLFQHWLVAVTFCFLFLSLNVDVGSLKRSDSLPKMTLPTFRVLVSNLQVLCVLGTVADIIDMKLKDFRNSHPPHDFNICKWLKGSQEATDVVEKTKITVLGFQCVCSLCNPCPEKESCTCISHHFIIGKSCVPHTLHRIPLSIASVAVPCDSTTAFPP